MKFLTKAESDFVVARINKDRSDALAEPFQLGKYLKHGADLKVWAFAALFGLTTTITYAIAFFLPIILRDGMGFSVAASQCLVAPPYVLAAIVMFGMAWFGDKWHIRSPFILANGVLALIGSLGPFTAFQTPANMCLRSSAPRLRIQRRRTILWRLSGNYSCQRQRPVRPYLASEQHSRSVEARTMLGHAGRLRWYWWYHWVGGVPQPGRPWVPSWYLLYDDRRRADHHDHPGP